MSSTVKSVLIALAIVLSFAGVTAVAAVYGGGWIALVTACAMLLTFGTVVFIVRTVQARRVDHAEQARIEAEVEALKGKGTLQG